MTLRAFKCGRGRRGRCLGAIPSAALSSFSQKRRTMSLAVTSKVNMAGLITARWKARSTFQLCRTKQPFGLRGRYDGKTVRSKTSRSEEHTHELQSLMRITYAVF